MSLGYVLDLIYTKIHYKADPRYFYVVVCVSFSLMLFALYIFSFNYTAGPH